MLFGVAHTLASPWLGAVFIWWYMAALPTCGAEKVFIIYFDHTTAASSAVRK